MRSLKVSAASLAISAASSASIESSAVFNKNNLVVLLYILDGTLIFGSATFTRYVVRAHGVDGYHPCLSEEGGGGFPMFSFFGRCLKLIF